MNTTEIQKMLEEVRMQNQAYYDNMRDTVWKLWEEQDTYLRRKIFDLQKKEDEMIDSMYDQEVKYREGRREEVS